MGLLVEAVAAVAAQDARVGLPAPTSTPKCLEKNLRVASALWRRVGTVSALRRCPDGSFVAPRRVVLRQFSGAAPVLSPCLVDSSGAAPRHVASAQLRRVCSDGSTVTPRHFASHRSASALQCRVGAASPLRQCFADNSGAPRRLQTVLI